MSGGVILGLGALGAFAYALMNSSRSADEPTATLVALPPSQPERSPWAPPAAPSPLPSSAPSPLPLPSPPAQPAAAEGSQPPPLSLSQKARTLALLAQADPLRWSMLELGEAGERVRVGIMAEPLTVGGKQVRVRPKESQWLADAHGGLLLTPYVAWQSVRHATVKLTPPQLYGDKSIEKLRAHIKAQLHEKLGRPLADGESMSGAYKWWVLAQRLWTFAKHDARAANFGLFPHGPAAGPVQGVGTRHRLGHVDWSQLHEHMAGVVQVQTPGGWEMWLTGAALQHPTYGPRLCGKKNHIYAHRVVGEGTLAGVRHPYIAPWASVIA